LVVKLNKIDIPVPYPDDISTKKLLVYNGEFPDIIYWQDGL